MRGILNEARCLAMNPASRFVVGAVPRCHDPGALSAPMPVFINTDSAAMLTTFAQQFFPVTLGCVVGAEPTRLHWGWRYEIWLPAP